MEKRNKVKRSSKELEYANKKASKELIIDTIILGLVLVGVLLAIGYIVGVLNGQNCN